jgi:hypothetical protein
MTGAKRRITIQAKNMIPYLKNNWSNTKQGSGWSCRVLGTRPWVETPSITKTKTFLPFVKLVILLIGQRRTTAHTALLKQRN